ncbi:MAG: biotin--[acetyl-CoA-carboxylase] ligase [Flavobacteriales bacterium]|nr:biotin--[acetyl-CoA-carboxylase] ligase [Flavobacteriales bacterium]|tara:strand:- start:214 stop:957 length:744 start_codon:yes stop_codon:yes gene_type:complete
MHASDIDFRIQFFDRLPSSNIHAQELNKKGEMRHGDVILTDYQLKGKGQKSARWDSKPKENLLFSLFLTLEIPTESLFQLNKMASLAIADLLDNLAVADVAVKWPNDILAKKRKICGILIENSIQGNTANHSVIGVGLNVNQIQFPGFDRQATSLKMELGKDMDRKILLEDLLQSFNTRINQLARNADQLNRDYHNLLYGRGRFMNFESEGNQFQGKVKGVDHSGTLIIEKGEEELQFNVKELKFLD